MKHWLIGAGVAWLLAGSAAAGPVVGVWAAGTHNGYPRLYTVMQITADGRIAVKTTELDQGMGYELAGVYHYDPASGVFQFQWTDYSPKQTCAGGFCAALPPPQPMRRPIVHHLRFIGVNSFSDGSVTWVRR